MPAPLVDRANTEPAAPGADSDKALRVRVYGQAQLGLTEATERRLTAAARSGDLEELERIVREMGDRVPVSVAASLPSGSELVCGLIPGEASPHAVLDAVSDTLARWTRGDIDSTLAMRHVRAALDPVDGQRTHRPLRPRPPVPTAPARRRGPRGAIGTFLPALLRRSAHRPTLAAVLALLVCVLAAQAATSLLAPLGLLATAGERAATILACSTPMAVVPFGRLLHHHVCDSDSCARRRRGSQR